MPSGGAMRNFAEEANFTVLSRLSFSKERLCKSRCFEIKGETASFIKE